MDKKNWYGWKMIDNRIFVVFAFENIEQMERFKATRCIDYAAARKMAGMTIDNTYVSEDVVELFEEPYSCYLIYELIDIFDEVVMGKTAQREIAS